MKASANSHATTGRAQARFAGLAAAVLAISCLAHVGSAADVPLSLEDSPPVRAEPTKPSMASPASYSGYREWERRQLTLDAHVLYLDGAATGPAAGSTDDAAELAKKLQNPVAAMISIPFQYNAAFNVGPKHATRSVLNIQPVIPFSLNDEWNLIVRTIVPLTCMDSPADGVPSRYGTGDIVQSFFFSPKAPTKDGWIWAVGPVMLWPSASDDSLGSGKFGAGPTGLLLKQESGWTYGILANHIWSYCGESDRASVNATFVQPFLSYTFPTYTTVGINTESTYDWNAQQWTVPINLSVSQLVKIGGAPVSFAIGGGYYAEGPTGGPDWTCRFVVTFLLPR